MLRIPITSLKPGVHEFDLAPSAADLELDPDVFSDIRVHVTLDYHTNQILASLQAEAVSRLECDRTLTYYDQPVRGTFRVLFAAPDVSVAPAEEADEAVRLLHPADQDIDLTTEARDTLLLALPSRRISPGAEDLDIQTQFGGPADGVDPRWDALRDLLPGNDQ